MSITGLDAGSLDRRVRIERQVPIDDGYQTRPGDWIELKTVWAQFKPGRGSERFEAASRRASLPAAFVIRWSSSVADVAPGDRVRFPAKGDGQLYDIIGVTPLGRRVGLELMCVTGGDG